jgi:hypothetical protein
MQCIPTAREIAWQLSAILLFCSSLTAAEHEWSPSKQFAEASFTETIDSNIRINVNAPIDAAGRPEKATRLIVYALPNGNTLEQTLGCKMTPALHWRYDGQHIAAQTRVLRDLEPSERIVLVCAEAPGLSWPSFRAGHKNASSVIARLVDHWRTEFGNERTKVFLTGHSGGGGFMFSVIEAGERIPAYIDRVAFLDANYNFDAEKHARKFEEWLNGAAERRLIVIAYDDREITLDGKKVLGPTGGTYRATGRMHDAFSQPFHLTDSSRPPFNESSGLDGRVRFFVHTNPKNKILHTVLIGEMNGLLHAATLGTSQDEKWGKFGGPRAYVRFVQAEAVQTPDKAQKAESVGKGAGAPVLKVDQWPGDPAKLTGSHLVTKPQSQLPPRQKGAIGGAEFMKSIERIPLADREAAILREITSGNFPEFLRNFKSVRIEAEKSKDSKPLKATLEVMPDYLSIGSDDDFVRIPMTPQTAQKIADRFGCTLPTRKMVDAIDRGAELHVAPHPMTKEREAIATFAEHNNIIEKQRGDYVLGLLLIGSKKDIVLTPRIFERPQRLAIYGWRLMNGQPIQPLTIVHWNQYVDYSHGVRLVLERIELDGKSTKVSELLADPEECRLVSDEGPMKPPRYPEK